LKQYLKKHGVIIGIVTFVMVLIALVAVLFAPGRVSFVQNGVNAIARPVETGIRNLVGTLERMYTHMHNYDTLEERYEELLDRLAEYERLVRRAAEIEEENERLRALFEFASEMDHVQFIDAYVLTWDASNWASAFTIDRGSEFGINVGDPVMTERGEFIGIVRDVGRSWASIQTVLDPATRIGGQMRTGVPAVAEGNFALMHQGHLRLSYVPSGEVPLLNDMVTTSGLGGIIPAGLTIGRIIHVSMEGTGVTYYAVLEPVVDLSRLTQVFIVQRLEEPDVEDGEYE